MCKEVEQTRDVNDIVVVKSLVRWNNKNSFRGVGLTGLRLVRENVEKKRKTTMESENHYC